jgi:hypothetical protein
MALVATSAVSARDRGFAESGSNPGHPAAKYEQQEYGNGEVGNYGVGESSSRRVNTLI